MPQQQLTELVRPGAVRLQSIDILRGAVMVLMAIDHVRVYSGVPAGGPEPAIFLTRWITHFCAPAFVFFAGTAAFLHGKKLGDASALARYLVIRGLLLVFLELTLIRLCWTFNLDYSEFVLAGVIWMLGWCMVLLSLFVRLRPGTVGIIGLAVIFLQQLFALVPRILPETLGRAWQFIYTTGMEPLPGISILYVIVPWIGVMATGYGFGTILLMEPARRNKLCLQIGLSATALYLVVGSILILMNPQPDDTRPFIFRLLNQQKYPASQLYLMMTLGPAIALVPLAERARGWLAHVLSIFGRVPFFYYLLHIPLIHLSALIVNLWRSGSIHHEWYSHAPFASVPPESRWSLAVLYLVWIVNVVILYFASRWYAGYKAGHLEKKWTKYL